jgi:hypothetical protein
MMILLATANLLLVAARGQWTCVFFWLNEVEEKKIRNYLMTFYKVF